MLLAGDVNLLGKPEVRRGKPPPGTRQAFTFNPTSISSLAISVCCVAAFGLSQHVPSHHIPSTVLLQLSSATVMPASASRLTDLQRRIWSGSIPLEIRLAASDCRTYDDSDSYFAQPPRLSYLAFLLPRLHAFFNPSLINPDIEPHEAWLSFEGVPLKWHYPLGLLYDLFSGAEPVDFDRQRKDEVAESQATVETASGISPLPWRLTVHFTDYPGDQLIQLDAEGRALLDSYINAVKEADFIRNGTARTVMSMSKDDSNNLWHAVETRMFHSSQNSTSKVNSRSADDLTLFNTVNNKLLYPPGLELRHVPIKIYLPTSGSQTASDTIAEEAQQAGHIRVVQSLVPLQLPSRQPQTLGTALNNTLPTIFPSRRNPLLAQPVLHGAVVPMGALIEDLGRAAAYADGFLHVAVMMLG